MKINSEDVLRVFISEREHSRVFTGPFQGHSPFCGQACMNEEH